MHCVKGNQNQKLICSSYQCIKEGQNAKQYKKTAKEVYQQHKIMVCRNSGRAQSKKPRIKISLKNSKQLSDQFKSLKRQIVQKLSHQQHQQLFDYLVQTGKDFQNFARNLQKKIQLNRHIEKEIAKIILQKENHAATFRSNKMQTQLHQSSIQQIKSSKQQNFKEKHGNDTKIFENESKIFENESKISKGSKNISLKQRIKAVTSLFEGSSINTEYNTQRPSTTHQSFIVKMSSINYFNDLQKNLQVIAPQKVNFQTLHVSSFTKKKNIISQARLATSKHVIDDFPLTNCTFAEN